MSDAPRTVILFNPKAMRGVGEDAVPPMGLLMAAINLHKEFRVVIIDARIDRNWKSRAAGLLKEKPVCVGVTALTGGQIRNGLSISRIAKEAGCPVVWGGVHASILPAQTLASPFVDYIVEGEGEESFAELVRALASGSPAKDIKGVWRKENGAAVFGGRRAFIDLNKLPAIPYHLIDLDRYIKSGPYGRTMIFYTSRGCPQRCTFCFNKLFNQSRWRAFSSGRVLDDMRNILKNWPHIRHFELWDDNFFVDLKRGREIAEGVMKLKPAVSWSVLGTHVRDVLRMSNEYLACLKASNLREVLTGAESGSQRIIDLTQKNFAIDDLFLYNRRLRNYGIRPTYSFISGIPGETDDDIRETVKVMFRLKKENPDIVLGNVKPFICYPGTAIYEKMTGSGFTPPKRLEEWSDFVWGNYLNLDVPWVSPKRRRFLSWLYYYTVLMNPQYIFIRSKVFILIASLLRPIAEWRVRKLWFGFPIEARLMHIIQQTVLQQ